MIGLDFIFLLQHIKDSTTISKSVTATIAPDRAIPRFRKRVSLPSEPIASVSAVVVVAAAAWMWSREFYFGILSIIIINTILPRFGRQSTAMSSECPQSWLVGGLCLQSRMADSVPVQMTSSRKMGPWPTGSRPTQLLASMYMRIYTNHVNYAACH